MLTLLFISLRIHFTFEIFRHMLSFFFIFSKKKGHYYFSALTLLTTTSMAFFSFFLILRKRTSSTITRKYILNPQKEMEEVQCTIMDDVILAHPLLRKTRYNFLGSCKIAVSHGTLGISLLTWILDSNIYIHSILTRPFINGSLLLHGFACTSRIWQHRPEWSNIHHCISMQERWFAVRKFTCFHCIRGTTMGVTYRHTYILPVLAVGPGSLWNNVLSHTGYEIIEFWKCWEMFELFTLRFSMVWILVLSS